MPILSNACNVQNVPTWRLHHDLMTSCACFVLAGRQTTDAWHTEKSFLMLEHMCRHLGGHFDWFMRSVDDAYIDVNRLRHLVGKLDPSKEVCEAFKRLSLKETLRLCRWSHHRPKQIYGLQVDLINTCTVGHAMWCVCNWKRATHEESLYTIMMR